MAEQNYKRHISSKSERLLAGFQMSDTRIEKIKNPMPWFIFSVVFFILSILTFFFVNKLAAIFCFIIAIGGLCYIALLLGRQQIAKHFTLLGQSLYNSPQGVLITDTIGKTKWCNRAFRILLPGVVPPDIKRGNILEGLSLYLANKEDIEAVHRMLQLAATGFEDRMTIMVRLPNGDPASRYVFVSPIDGQEAILWQVTQLQEDAAGLNASLSDTENKYAKEEDDTHFDETKILDHMPCGWFSMNEEGVVLSVNDGFLKIIGVSEAQILKGDFQLSDYIISAKPMEYSESSALLQGRESQNMNGIIHIRRGENGQTVKAWLYQTPQFNDDGTFVATNSIIIPEPHDSLITKEAITEKAVEPVKSVIASDIPVKFANIPMPLIWIDAHRNIKKVNRAFTLLFEQTEDNIIGQPFSILFPSAEGERLQTFLYRVAAGAKSLTLEGLQGLSGQDSLSIRLYAIDAMMDNPNEILLGAQDVSDINKLRSKMSEAEKDQMIGQAAGSIIHDFKNMLGAIIGGAETIMDRVGPDNDIYPDAHTILNSAYRANNLTQWLNRMNRKETGEKNWFDINQLLSNARPALQTVITKKHELIIIRSEDTYGIKLEETAFDQILMNLITNARDAMANNGKVTISSEKHVLNQTRAGFPDDIPVGEWSVIKVQDTGSGIPSHILERIFEKRFTTKKAGRGTGIGLDSVRQMVRAQDGFVNVETEEGKGTLFEIWFPYIQGEAAKEKQAKKYIPQDLTGVGRILVVEDEDQARGYTVKALKQRGYEVLEAVDGQEGLDIIYSENGNFDLIISDISMPRLDGPSMIKESRAHYSDIAVLIISGNSGEDLDRDLEKIGDVPFLAKPYTLEGLVLKVKDILTKKKQQKEASQPAPEQGQKDLFALFTEKSNINTNNNPAKMTNKPKEKIKRSSDSPDLFDDTNQESLIRKPLIILVDDEDTARVFMARKLQSSGFEVFEADDGVGGLDLVLDPNNIHALQLVVTDVNMLSMHGPELATKIWAQLPNLPIVFLSGNIGELRDSVKNSNAYFMEKPITPNKLLEKIQEILE